MKNIQLITRQITLWALLTAGLFLNTSGQVYQPGDLYTFEDGSKGIVFYVNPDNPGSGTVAALHDLGEQYALWNGNKPSVMKNSTLHRYDFDYSGNISWSHEGKLFTQLLKASGASPLADTIGAEIDNGWYIPDVVQLRCLLAMAPYLEEYFAAQQGEVFNMWNRNYWSSCFSPYEENKVYYVDKIRFNITDGSNSKYIRLVRDFPDSSVVHAFWKEFPPLSETKVSPDSTRDYDALVILRSDTIRLSGSVTVHHPVQDTIIYATSSSQLSDGEFIAACHTFTNITAPGSYTARDTLTAANGCDSIVVVTLIVTEDAHYYDTICPQVEQYVFAPFDTVFLSGTVSGEYIHHGSKVVDGHTVDTTAYLHLTVLPVYDNPDTVNWCLYGESETMPYEHDPRVTLSAESTGGTVTISATSSTSAITIEEGTSTGDFLLRMTTVHGCDSIVRLHVRTTAVARDTLYYDVSASHVTEGEITTACHTFTGITAPGSYTARDTLTAANGCDSIVVITLIVTEDAHYYDTICPQVEQYVFAPFDTVFLSGTASGEYIHHGSKVVDGHTVDTTAYLHLTVLPVYDIPDTVSWCLYGESETMPYPNDPRVTLSAESTGGTVTISATSSTSAITIEEGTAVGDFLLHMTTVHGCDSIVRLHIRTTAVARDTLYSHVSVQQVQDNRVTVDNHTFENVNGLGSYTTRDTLTAANGCDSIVVVTLIVTEDAHYYDTICPQMDQYAFAPFDTVFLSGTVSGEYIHHGSKVVNGHTVDTTAYLHLTVLPVYDIPDTVSWCLYGNVETMPYPNDPRITLSAESTGGTVTISATSSTSAITIEEGTSTGDFLLRMTTVHGCDSIVRLHVRTTAVTRDTIYSHVSVQQVQDNRVTVDNYTFENVNGLGSYTARDTLTAANGCDSIVVITLIVTEDAHYYDTICPQVDHYAFAPFDTVFLSGTVSGEYIHHGSKVVDGHTVDTTAYLHLTVLPVYDIPDTVSWCLYGNVETMPYPNDPRITLSAETNDGTVTISATSSNTAITIEEGTAVGDFLLRMTTVHGCDSIVRLHVRTTAVARDTMYSHISVQQVQDNRVTVDNYTFENVNGLGSYTARDTLTAANGCDSIVIVTLIVTEDAHYYDTICPQVEQYAFAPFDTVFLSGTVSGEYVHHGSKLIDGHTVDTTAYLHLTVLPVYDIPDTVSWCLYGESETMPYPNDPRITLSAETNDGTVTISATSSTPAITIEEGTSTGDFLLRMTTVHGCDSIVRLHIRTTAVARDTLYSHVSVQQVQDNRVTVDNHTFENVTGLGSYTARDTLTAANGCDSIVVVTLIVTEDAHYYDTICPQVEQYVFAPFDTVFLSGTVSGEYVHHGSKLIDGHTVDTTAYLHLTVLPVYDTPDTVNWCLYGNVETMPYPNDPRITLSAETNDGTVTISATSSNTAITIEEGTAVGDFLLHMTTVHGCDSIVRLHVRTTAVTRDTLYSHVSVQQVQDNRVTVDNYTFENVTAPGSYTTRDTLTAANGCDSIVVVELIVTEDAHYYDTICPQVDHYAFAPFDTVFLSGTVSGEYIHHGSKVIDGHTVDTTAFLHLTVLPVYDIPDTVSWCLYGESETMPYPNDPRITLSAETNDGTVTISATSSTSAITIEEGTAVGDFLLHMTTVHGCDSIVRLHVRTTAVTRDTIYSHVSVQQVQDNRVTVDNYTFENVNGLGSYTARDTLTAANGCDSIVVVTLIVTEDAHYYDTICPQVEQYVFAPFDTVFLSGTVSGEYVHHGSKVIDGHTVDTTAFLHLTVLPVYDISDTVSWCLYGESETMPYPNDPRITLSAETNDGTVTISATSSTSAITIEEGTAVGDFLLRMTTVHGCDSIVRLHVRTTAVTRDTMYSHVSVQQVQENRVTVDNHTFENVTGLGSYTARDTLTAANGCDSIVVVTLIVTEDAHYYDTICPQMDQYAFAPFDTVFLSGTASGEYVHHGSKVIDGHTVDTTAYLHLTVLPVYDIPDTVSWCLYGESETMPYPNDPHVTLTSETNNGTVTITATSSTSAIIIEEGTSTGDFLLRMTTVHGCDSIVRLHVRTTAVARDTTYSHVSVQQVQDNRVTVDHYTFENVTDLGSYTTRDTLTAANGCDSIVVVTLIVTEDAHYYDTICPQVEQYAFAPFDTVFLSGTASGEYVHHGSKVIDGHTVDTTAYLHLTVLPVYDIPDTVSWCLYGESETMPYPNDPRITLSAESTGGTVTISATSSNTAITIEEGTAVGDFLLRMTTVHGCDSIVRLHVRTTAVTRDTIYSHVSVQQVQDNRVTVDHYTFENVTDLGSYTTRDTLTAANGCDSIVVVELIVNGCSVDFTISCPPDIYDTLAFGDCAMTIYPEEIGTPTIQCDQEWPFFIRNDMPESSVFPQGDNIITWIATDSICGFSDTCEQHVFIAYPQCPDAIDCEGNIYAGIRIGCDCWTQRNLESTKYSDCTDIPDVMGYASLLHPDTANNIAIFGRLYTFEAAVRDSADNGHGHIQGICPEGWYLPTPEKYESLNEYGTEALRSPLYWIIGAGNNSTGFSALPAGYYNGEKSRYEGLLSETYFWSSQGVGTHTMRTPSFIAYYCDQVLLQDLNGGLGYSVRCIKERE